jgi:hypothetical protein
MKTGKLKVIAGICHVAFGVPLVITASAAPQCLAVGGMEGETTHAE